MIIRRLVSVHSDPGRTFKRRWRLCGHLEKGGSANALLSVTHAANRIKTILANTTKYTCLKRFKVNCTKTT